MTRIAKKQCENCGHLAPHHKIKWNWKDTIMFLLRFKKGIILNIGKCQVQKYNGKMRLIKYHEGEKCGCKKFMEKSQ